MKPRNGPEEGPGNNLEQKMETMAASLRTTVFSGISGTDVPPCYPWQFNDEGLRSDGSAIARAAYVQIGGKLYLVVMQSSPFKNDDHYAPNNCLFRIIPAGNASTHYDEYRLRWSKSGYVNKYVNKNYNDYKGGLQKVTYLKTEGNGGGKTEASPSPNTDLFIEAIDQAFGGMTKNPKSVAFNFNTDFCADQNYLFEDLPEDGGDYESNYIRNHDRSFNQMHADALLRLFRRGEFFLSVGGDLVDLFKSSPLLFTEPELYKQGYHLMSNCAGTVLSMPVIINGKFFELIVGSSRFKDKDYFGGDPEAIKLSLRSEDGKVVAVKLQHVANKGSFDMEVLSGETVILRAKTQGNSFTIAARNTGCHLFAEDKRFRQYSEYHGLALKGRPREGVAVLKKLSSVINALRSQGNIADSGTIEEAKRQTRRAAAVAAAGVLP